MGQCLERMIGDQGVIGSNPGRVASELWQFRFASVFWGDTKQLVASIWCICQGK